MMWWRKVIGAVPTMGWVVAAGVAVVLGGLRLYAEHERSVGREEVRRVVAEQYLARASLRVAALQRTVDSLTKAERVELVETVRWRTRWDTLRVTLPDTGRVGEALQAGEQALSACERAGATCRARAALLAEQLAIVSAQRDTIVRYLPVAGASPSCRGAKLAWGIGGAAAGALGVVIARP